MAQKTRKEVRLSVAALHAHLLEGLEPDEIMTVEGWNEQDFEFFYRKLIDQEVAKIQDRSIEEIYFHYALDQGKCIRALDQVAKRFGKSKQYNALVGAIKAKSEIFDKIITRGQEFELIHKAPKGIKFIGQVAVDNLSSREVKKMMERELGELALLQNSKLGDTFAVNDDGLTVMRGGADAADIIDITPRLVDRTGTDENDYSPAPARARKTTTPRMKGTNKIKVRRTKRKRILKEK